MKDVRPEACQGDGARGFDQVTSTVSGEFPAIKAVALRPYQLEARESILSELSHVRGTLLTLATGLGKTVTFAAVAEAFVSTGQRVLVLAHRGELIEQAANTLRRFGLRVGIEQGGQRVDRESLPDVVIASVQTLRGKRLQSFAAGAFGLIVVDEAHHAIAATYRGIFDHFASAKLLGVTATPDRADGIGLRNVFDSVAYRMELGAGIREQWLSPIELRSIMVQSLDLSRVRCVAGELHAGELEAELTRDRVLHEIAAPMAELSDGRKTLAFTAGVAQAHALAEVLNGHGVMAAAVDGSMSAGERGTVLEAYRSGRVQLVCNSMLWTEGFDAPETACVALVKPTRSRSLIAQMIGRGTRLHVGKTSCLVLDFVPGRSSNMRLAAPADALAGAELPTPLLERVRAMSGLEAADLDVLIERARAQEAEAQAAALNVAEAQRAEAARLVRSVGVVFVAHRVDVSTLLDAVRHEDIRPPTWPSRPASHAQRDALEKAGFKLPDVLSASEAATLFDILSARRAKGLCTLKQARKLRSFGLRDDVDSATAWAALTAISANGWRPPAELYRDPRFSRVERSA